MPGTGKKYLEEMARQIRCLSVESIYRAQSGHPGGSLSAADILSVLYFDIMNIDPQDPTYRQRDRLILSKGHGAPAYYAALALRGYFDTGRLNHLRQGEEELQGHPSMHKTPGVDYSSGSLGQGLSIANGMALYAMKNGLPSTIFCLCGDGELEEGQIWEAVMAGAHYKLSNVVLIVDDNGLQIDGHVADVMNHAPLKEKFLAFGWSVLEVDGHDVKALQKAFYSVYRKAERPTVLLAKTVKGKGVSFMENQVSWHGSAPTKEQYEQAMRELGGKRL